MQSASTFPFHFHFHVLDADGLRDYIILHSHYNVEEGTQSKERYFLPPNQSIIDIPINIQHLYLCGFEDYGSGHITFSNNSFYLLKSITIGYEGVCDWKPGKVVWE